MNEFNERGGPVCVFDSGIGGLNLLAECAALCPDRDFIYFADNDNVPYGNMTRARMRELVFGIFDEIAGCNPSAAVVACNTVTAAFIRDLRAAYPFPIVGIQPAVKQAAAALKGFDAEIIEMHHTQKKDAPSGTAIMLADGIKEVLPEKY